MSLRLPSGCRFSKEGVDPCDLSLFPLGEKRVSLFSALQGQMVCSLQFPLVTCLLQMTSEKCKVACWQNICSRDQFGMYLLKEMILPPS